MKLADFPSVQALSPREKLELVDELWISLGEDMEDLEISDDEKQILEQRWAAYEKNPDSALTLEEFKSKFAASRK